MIPLLKEQVAARLNNAAAFWVAEAQANANVDTGFMKNSTGVTVPATPNSLFTVIRCLAPYGSAQDTGIRGNLWWTRAFLATREKFTQFLYDKVGSAGPGVIRAALQEYHGPLGNPRGGKP